MSELVLTHYCVQLSQLYGGHDDEPHNNSRHCRLILAAALAWATDHYYSNGTVQTAT